MTSSTSIDVSLKHKEMVILGSQYAGEGGGGGLRRSPGRLEALRGHVCVGGGGLPHT